MTSRYLSGDVDEDRVAKSQRFSRRNSDAEHNKILRTSLMRAAEAAADLNVEALPLADVRQVYSLYSEIEHGGTTYLAVVRKTLTKISETGLVVGDRVRFRAVPRAASDPAGEPEAESGQPEAVIDDILPRETVLTRADSFKGIEQHPIVANARQMLIVASVASPSVKWGLIDRMIIAAQAGKLTPILCLNKMDLADTGEAKPREVEEADAALAHYTSLLIPTLRTSIGTRLGLDELRAALAGQTTVLAGHSGVGKSSLINAIQPGLKLRTGAISGYTGKGRHTTSSARHYPLDFGGPATAVIDTPGVKLFGLWGVTRKNLRGLFPDVAAGTAPPWRAASYERIAESLPPEEEGERAKQG